MNIIDWLKSYFTKKFKTIVSKGGTWQSVICISSDNRTIILASMEMELFDE